MKIIKYDEAERGANSDKCKTLEYSFGDTDIDIGVAIITGRYPEEGYCMNTKCKELIYVIDGEGELNFENKAIKFSKDDAILIDKNKKYYWNTDYCKVSMTCTPAWTPEQHKLVK